MCYLYSHKNISCIHRVVREKSKKANSPKQSSPLQTKKIVILEKTPKSLIRADP